MNHEAPPACDREKRGSAASGRCAGPPTRIISPEEPSNPSNDAIADRSIRVFVPFRARKEEIATAARASAALTELAGTSPASAVGYASRFGTTTSAGAVFCSNGSQKRSKVVVT